MGLTFGILFALFLLIVPGTTVARSAQLTWPIAVAIGPALTFGVVAFSILVQGLTMRPFLELLRLAADKPRPPHGA